MQATAALTVLLYYKYVPLPDPAAVADAQRELCRRLGILGRILIGAEGINGTCCGTPEAIAEYKAATLAHPLLSDIAFKESSAETQPFFKLIVRLRPEVVALKTQVDLKNTGKRMSPEELHTTLENGEDVVLIDMRNDYEAHIGKFKDAVVLPMHNFRDLPDMMPHLEQYKDKKVITYCTGGIRCEKASALLNEHGFKDVSQLEGGIVTYAEKFPDGYFEGACFVFDERMALRYQGKNPRKILTKCTVCDQACDEYIDCTDIACHAMFICCGSCKEKNKGLCVKHK